jgi:hypothetical protein
MRQRIIIWIGALGLTGLMLMGCTLTLANDTPSVMPTGTPTHIPITPSPPPSSTPAPTGIPALETYTGPYEDVVGLLDGVCFDFLADIDGETWMWDSPGALGAFYDRVDESETCSGPVERGTYDFSERVLVGAVNVSTGCDAAHSFAGLAQDNEAHTQTIRLQLLIQPDCPYELVQPFLITMPRPPDGYTIRVVVILPPDATRYN